MKISYPARTAYLLLIIVAFLVYSVAKPPKHNWDMIGYVASAYSYLGWRGQALADKTFADIRATY